MNDDLIQQLQQVSESLSDRSIALLRDALAQDDTSAAAMEKKMTQARRAVEKAIHLLQNVARNDSAVDGDD